MEVHRSFCHKILKERDNTGTCAMVICISLCHYGSGVFFLGGGVIEFGAKAYFPEMNSAQWGASRVLLVTLQRV